MVKTRDVRPGFGVMASFASEARSARALAVHSILEFPMMRVGVAGRTSHIVKAEWKNFIRTMRLARCVAIRARHGGMCASKRETGFAMFRNRVQRTVKINNRVARLAAVVVWRGGKLVVVHILMAIRASSKLNLVLRILPCRRMALGALYGNMFALQGIFRSLVFFYAE